MVNVSEIRIAKDRSSQVNLGEKEKAVRLGED
jgi:hypothetical protein